jgi:hypothetical protein
MKKSQKTIWLCQMAVALMVLLAWQIGQTQTAAATATVTSTTTTTATGTTTTSAPQGQPDRATLLKVKPSISGARDGIYIEPDALDFVDHTGYVSLFDGKTLDGWDGRPGVWSVEDGAIVGESTAEKNAGNSFLVYKNVTAHDFDLKVEIKVELGGGSGIQYRSTTGVPDGRMAGRGEAPVDARWMMIGPQADFWYPVGPRQKMYSGQLYSQNTSRGIVAWRGQVVESEPTANNEIPIPQLVGNIGDRAALGVYVKDGDWNEYEIIARGGVILHILNGQLMAVLVDDDPASSSNASGLFGLQIEHIPCKVSFRNIWLRKIN